MYEEVDDVIKFDIDKMRNMMRWSECVFDIDNSFVIVFEVFGYLLMIICVMVFNTF